MIKNIAQSPFNQSTKAPEDAAKVVRPAVPIEAIKHIVLQCKFYLLASK